MDSSESFHRRSQKPIRWEQLRIRIPSVALPQPWATSSPPCPPREGQWPAEASSFHQSNMRLQILLLMDLLINEFCLKPSSCRNLARGLLLNTSTNSVATLDTGLLHSVTFPLMDDVPKCGVCVITAYEWVSTFHSQTKIMPRRTRNQQTH